ncbi:MAG: DNA glycosylase, partial [Halobacteria archaeon]|nr:DNA glycosylase [Halobacteria archaeon]
MNTGTLNERIDLINTLESGQTFLWERVGDGVYETVLDGEAIRVKEDGPVVRYETTGDVSEAEDTIREALGLDCSLDAVHSSFPDDARLEKAVERYGGMRVVSDPFFPCAVSFIISAQNRIPRIKKLVSDIRREYGEAVDFGDGTLYSFPDPSTLAQVPEDELRDLGLGYRAPYVVETSRMVADGEVDPDEIRSMGYHDAHNAVQGLVGVGD